jgi:hypothetical protein
VATVTTPEAPINPNPPTVAIEDPQAGSTIKGAVQLTITFTDPDNDVNEMEIFLDGVKVESRIDISSPQMWEWNTKNGDDKVKNGDHTIKVTVTDKGGHSASDETTYKVKNEKKDEPKGFIPGPGMILISMAFVVVVLVRHRAQRP